MSILTFPNTVDGNVLRKIAEKGIALSKPMLIDFAIDCSDEDSANEVLKRLEKKGFIARTYCDEEDNSWSVYVPVEMIPDHDEIVDFQNALDEDLAQFGAKSDGWGTFGN